jgi:ATP-dependent DNA ligase
MSEKANIQTEKARGLYLVEPHGEMVADGRKKAVAKSRRFDLEGGWVLVSGKLAYGTVTLGAPEEVGLDEFDARFEEHRVTPEERRRWWPAAKTLWIYPVKRFEPYPKPKRVRVPPGTQTVMREVSLEGEKTRADLLLERLAGLPDSFVWVPDFVSLTGSQIYAAKDREPNDADVILRAQETEGGFELRVPVDAAFALKLERLLKESLGAPHVQYTGNPYGPNWMHLPLYDLCLVRKPELVYRELNEPAFATTMYKAFKTLSASALERLLRGASAEVRRQAKVSYDEDEVVPGRPFVPLKPMRPAEESQRQLFSRFVDFVNGLDSWPCWVSAKRDGVRHTVHRKGNRVYIFSDDGTDNADQMPELVERFKRFGKGDWVVDCEIEFWRDRQHYPREAAAGAVHSGQETEFLVANIFLVVFWEGQDLHGKDFSENWAIMKDLPADTFSEDALDGKKNGLINVIPHHRASKAEFESVCLRTAYRSGVEGVVVKFDGRPCYPLDGGPGDPVASVKFHKNAAFDCVVLEAVETKTAGVFNYYYGLPAGDRKPAHARELGGKTYLEIGKTFSTTIHKQPGDLIQVEAETVNQTEDRKRGVVDVSFWVPNFIQDAEVKEADSLDAVLRRAEEHGVLQGKVVTEAGETEYLPTHPGGPATASKEFQIETNSDELVYTTLSSKPTVWTIPSVWSSDNLGENSIADEKAISLKYPPEDKKYPFVLQLHYRGRSVHGDYRASHGDTLEGWTIALQQPEAIKEPVTTLEAAKKAAADPANWKMDLKTGLIKPRQIRGGTVRRGDLRAFPKATEIPKDWLSVEGVTDKPDPGEAPPAGATANFPGVFDIVQKGSVEHGAKKPFFLEYFVHGDTWGDQRWTFRMLGREEKGLDAAGEPLYEWTDLTTGERLEINLDAIIVTTDWMLDALEEIKAELLPPGVEEQQARSRVYWVLLQADPEPYVLSKNAIEKDWLPPKGVSCLPKKIRVKVPKDLRYWEVSGEEALARRAKLAEMDLRELDGTETKADEKLHLEQFRAGGVDSDLAHPKERRRELTADLRYLGNSAYPRLKKGQPWGEWKLEDVLRYFAKIVDVLRSEVDYAIQPPKKGDEGYDSSYWQCYREAERYMKTQPPAHRSPSGKGEKQAGEWRPYVLQRHWFKHPIVVIRWGPSEQHYYLRVKLNGKHWHLVLQGDSPLEADEIAAYEETKESGDVETPEGTRVNIFEVPKDKPLELAPDQAANPNKKDIAFIQTVDSGEARVLSEQPEFRKLEFRGGKLKGAWIFRREEPGGSLGTFSRSAGPRTKELDMQEITVLIDDEQAGDKARPACEETPQEKKEHSCVCPTCGTESESEQPCGETPCPQCGAAMADRELPAEPETAGVQTERAVTAGTSGALASQVKAGRRIRGDKLDLLKTFRDKVEKLLDDLKEVIGWGEYEDGQPPQSPLEAWLAGDGLKALEDVGTAAFAFKAADGRTWWLQFTTNAFQDREREIFTTQALENYVARHRGQAEKGEFWYRHIPGTKFADVTWQALSGRFLAQAGPFDDTPVGTAFKEFFTQHPRSHPEIAPLGWGTSHGYHYDAKDREDGVYEWFEIKESSVLPAHVASNPWNPMPMILTEVKMNEQEIKELETIGGPDLVSLVRQLGEQRTKDLEVEGVAYKAGWAEKIRQIASKIDDEGLKQRVTEFADKLEGAYPYPKPAKKKEAEEAEDEKAGKLEKLGQELRLVAGKVGGAAGKALGDIADEMLKASKYPKPGAYPAPQKEAGGEEKPEPGKKGGELTREEVAEAILDVAGTLRGEMARATKAAVDEAVAAITQALTPLVEEVKALKQSDAEKVLQTIGDTPAASLSALISGRLGAKSARVEAGSPLTRGPQQTEAPARGVTGVSFIDNYIANADQR